MDGLLPNTTGCDSCDTALHAAASVSYWTIVKPSSDLLDVLMWEPQQAYLGAGASNQTAATYWQCTQASAVSSLAGLWFVARDAVGLALAGAVVVRSWLAFLSLAGEGHSRAVEMGVADLEPRPVAPILPEAWAEHVRSRSAGFVRRGPPPLAVDLNRLDDDARWCVRLCSALTPCQSTAWLAAGVVVSEVLAPSVVSGIVLLALSNMQLVWLAGAMTMVYAHKVIEGPALTILLATELVAVPLAAALGALSPPALTGVLVTELAVVVGAGSLVAVLALIIMEGSLPGRWYQVLGFSLAAAAVLTIRSYFGQVGLLAIVFSKQHLIMRMMLVLGYAMFTLPQCVSAIVLAALGCIRISDRLPNWLSRWLDGIASAIGGAAEHSSSDFARDFVAEFGMMLQVCSFSGLVLGTCGLFGHLAVVVDPEGARAWVGVMHPRSRFAALFV